jgi:hypothetical protein
MGRYTTAAAAALLAALLTTPQLARAEDGNASVIVLSIRSNEGDDQFVRNLTGALRGAAGKVQKWDLSEREVSLAQMTLAHGCDEADAACMSKIADVLKVDRVIYGTTRRTSAGKDYDYSVNLYFFNSETDRIEASIADTVPRVQSDIDDLRARAERYIGKFSGKKAQGTLRVASNVPGATVRIDGKRVGSTDAQGNFVASDVPVGRHRVEVSSEQHTSFRGAVNVSSRDETELEVTLSSTTPAQPTHPVSWYTYLSWGVAAVSGSLLIWSGVRTLDLKQKLDAGQYEGGDSEVARWYQEDDTRGRSNVCGQASIDAANPGGTNAPSGAATVADWCDEANVVEPLQYVFGAGAAVAGGLGIYFLYRDLSGASEQQKQQQQSGGMELTLTPSFGPQGGHVTATLRF